MPASPFRTNMWDGITKGIRLAEILAFSLMLEKL